MGRFAGLVRTDVNGRPQEMIKLLYRNDDIILVSIHSLHKLSKYRGKEGVPPKVNKLGSGAWNRLKERTKTRVKDIARDLIRLYAARREQKGHAFAPDSYTYSTSWRRLSSMRTRPTGDKGHAGHQGRRGVGQADGPPRLRRRGLRKDRARSPRSVQGSRRREADCRPRPDHRPRRTQHHRTFADRLRDLPVRVDFISRARKPKEVKQILADLEAGKIDILVGTHKIIGKGVKFKDLGLLVIDEEQKFGVAVKEKLKQMKVNVDTLTMSATPIPRTLQFSLSWARETSARSTLPGQPAADTDRRGPVRRRPPQRGRRLRAFAQRAGVHSLKPHRVAHRA